MASASMFPPRPVNPMLWTDEEPAQGVFVGSADESLHLLDMPQGVQRRDLSGLARAESASPALRAFLVRTSTALAAQKAEAAATILSLEGLDAADRAILNDILGRGEVSMVCGQEPLYQITESVLPGLWGISGDGREWLEVGDVPALVRQTAAQARAALPPLPEPPAGCMNAPAVLAEIAARAAAWPLTRSGSGNHVINFTLLPMTPADLEFLTAVLGQIPLTIISGGYGACRIHATGLQHVWAVQFMNSMGTVILDTLEIGDVPDAARAAVEDFQDSAIRLDEILAAYLPNA